MKVEQLIYSGNEQMINKTELSNSAQLVFVFGSRNLICNRTIFDNIRSTYPNAFIMGCTTSGEIYNNSVFDDTLSATAVFFERTKTLFSTFEINNADESYNIAKRLALSIPHGELKHVFVLSEGVTINGSKLVEGLRDNLPKGVIVTGGLSGDGDRFKETYLIANGYAKKNIIVAAAFYGSNLKVGYGSVGGWNTFGIERVVTKSKGTELFEIDGKPALDLYKEYLGEYSNELPASGLLFPLCIRSKNSDYSFVRAMLGMNEKNKSLLFRAEVPEGAYCKLMKANFSSLVNGSIQSAQSGMETLGLKSAKLGILISCIGRKLVLKQMVDEEIEAAREIIGSEALFTGFYSYGEIAPLKENTSCELHNQTMTITLIDEV